MLAKTEGTCRACGQPIRVGQDLNGRNRHNNCRAAAAAVVTVSPSVYVPAAPVVPIVRATTCRRCGGPISVGHTYCGEC